jgi:hypothetical protein
MIRCVSAHQETRRWRTPSVLLDPVPIWAVFVLFAVVTLACYEIGFHVHESGVTLDVQASIDRPTT